MIKAKPFGLKQVRLLDGLFKDAMERDSAYLLGLEVDRLLVNFRVAAGLPTTAEPVGGWEDPSCELRGHSLGHYLTACALMYASSGDERFKERVDYTVAQLGLCQDALPARGYNRGFLSAYPESFFDRVERREPVWAPYYTLHKIMAGLLDAYEHCGNEQALTVVERMAEWIRFRVSHLTREQMQITLLNEPGGMNEVLANLYAATGKPEHLELTLAFNDDVVLEPLADGRDQLDRLHANTQIPKAIGTARQYELTGDERLRDTTRFFWERVAFARSYVIGGNSDDELFFPVNAFHQHLSTVSAETCNTYNMLKLTRHIFSWEPSARSMDFYERGLYNHILASQDPKSGMMLYFASLKPGHFKVYSTPHDAFWCCTGTGMENHAKYGDTIYYHDDETLYVNLFIASELRWDEKGLVVRQETRFPEADSSQITLECQQPTRLAVKIRYPGWCTGMEVQVNGEAVTVTEAAGSYVTVEREWQNGDVIQVRLPMALHVEALPDAPNCVAVLYGPVVLAGALGTANMPNVYMGNINTRLDLVNWWPTPAVPVLKGTAESVLEHIKAVGDEPLRFRSEGIGAPTDVELIPFYRLHHQRYTVYWELA